MTGVLNIPKQSQLQALVLPPNQNVTSGKALKEWSEMGFFGGQSLPFLKTKQKTYKQIRTGKYTTSFDVSH